MKNKNTLYIISVGIVVFILMRKNLGLNGLKLPYSSLSSYTIAKNCTDLNDCEIGIEELKNFIKFNYPSNTPLAYKRLNALTKKINLLKNK